MKPLHQLLLGAGLLLTGPAAGAQQRADYAGVWLNTDGCTRSAVRLVINNPDGWTPTLTVWEGLPINPSRRALGQAAYRPNSDGTVPRLMVRRVTADVAEMYYLDLQSDGALGVLRHVSVAGTTARCDTMRFERLRNPGAVGKRSGRRTAERFAAHCPPAPPEVALRFTSADTPSRTESALVAFRPR